MPVRLVLIGLVLASLSILAVGLQARASTPETRVSQASASAPLLAGPSFSGRIHFAHDLAKLEHACTWRRITRLNPHTGVVVNLRRRVCRY